MAEHPTDEHITYQLHYRKCRKPSCRQGPGHGPYWYAYWRDGTRLRSVSIGKVRPVSLDTSLDHSAPESTLEPGSDGAAETPHLGEGTSRE
jgi:hypothetical protein